MKPNEIENIRSNSNKAENYFLNKIAFSIDPTELKEINSLKNIKIIDVRFTSDFEGGHIPNSVSIPLEEIENRLEELNKDDLHIIYSYNSICNRSKKAGYILAKNSFSVIELLGGFESWTRDFHYSTN